MKPRAKRKTVGILIDQLTGRYQSPLWGGIIQRAEKLGLDTIFFTGKNIQLEWAEHYQHEIVYKMVDPRRIDGLLCFPTGIAINSSVKIDEFLKNYKGIPLVNISTMLEGYLSVIPDGRQGIRLITEHLIHHHGLRDLVFVSGPRGIYDSEERLKGFGEALKGSGITGKPRIYDGNFSIFSGEEAARELLNHGHIPKGIVCANDEMAMGVITVLKRAGYAIPNDIAVTGFDDISESRFSDPRISTVSQPIFEIGEAAVQTLYEIFQGETPEQTLRIPVRQIFRESCGCESNIIRSLEGEDQGLLEEVLKMFEQQGSFTYEHLNSLRRSIDLLINDCCSPERTDELAKIIQRSLSMDSTNYHDSSNWHRLLNGIRRKIHHCVWKDLDSDQKRDLETNLQILRVRIGEQISYEQGKTTNDLYHTIHVMRESTRSIVSASNLDRLKEILPYHLETLTIRSCFICLYDEPFYHNRPDEWRIPESSRLVFAYHNGELPLAPFKESFSTIHILSQGSLKENELHHLHIQPLFQNRLHMGYVVFSIRKLEELNHDFNFESLRDVISTVVFEAKILRDLRVSREELQRSYELLKNQAVTDELTGLYNRRGFMTVAEKQYKIAQRTKDGFMIAFIDLDGLKIINDTYGHKEGDLALRTAAEILRLTFREMDILARLGGDEFIVLMPHTALDLTTSEVSKRLQDNVDSTNERLGKPYLISMSVGFYPHKKMPLVLSLDQMMAQADMELYKNKAKKKARYDNVRDLVIPPGELV